QADHYDSRKMFLVDNDELLRSDQVGLAVLHPGYLDEYIFRNTTCNVARCIDVGTLTDPIVKRHLDDLGVELITSNDYLFGTNDYQNYLRLKTAKN
ncbi:MAG: hypothetical protein K6D03_09205, partial [Solobacterium sp.]|nr:hypothetical protein [Solobacterium sp.]